MMSAFAEAARQIAFGLQHVQPGVVAHGGRTLVWRHHGLGMLQAELSESLRVHFWHPSLVSPGMAWPRCVHDHRFDITSAVVVGEIVDVACHVRSLPQPFAVPFGSQEVNIYEIEHAKNQDRMVLEKGCSTATSARLIERAVLDEEEREYHRAGDVYTIPRCVFHTSRVNGLAITVIHRSNFNNRLARVLCAPENDVTATSGIVRDESPSHDALVRRVINEAMASIREAAR